jgi:DNA-binding NarL/FixJ family response regulator
MSNSGLTDQVGGTQPRGEESPRAVVITGGMPPNLVGNAQAAPLRVTLVHHDESVRGFVAKVAAAQHWVFEARRDFAEAADALGVPLPDSDDTPPAGAAPAAAVPQVFLAALRPPTGPCGLEFVRRLAALDGQARFVLVAQQADAALGFSAIYSGASAFILLPLKRAELLTAVRRAGAGQRFLPAGVQEASLDALCCPEQAQSCASLTPREIKVLWAMGHGRGEKGAAQLLGLATHTVHTHANHIFLKLDVHSLQDALNKVFGERGCTHACARRERDKRKTRR